MLGPKGNIEAIKSVVCLNICRNYFKHMKKNIIMQETSVIMKYYFSI